MQAEMSKLKKLAWDSDDDDSENDFVLNDRSYINVNPSPSIPPTNGTNPSTSRSIKSFKTFLLIAKWYKSTYPHCNENQDVVEKLIECPTCHCFFPLESIAEHADMCCDIWVGSVNDGHTSSEDSDLPNPNPPAATTVACENVKEVILKIKETVMTTKVTRLNLRRKYLWVDFKKYWSNGKVSPADLVKITFIGEPAIDDGGPKREFFSGILSSCFT